MRGKSPGKTTDEVAGQPFEEALRLLARKPLTGAEIRGRLEDRGFAEPEIDDVLERLRSAGYVDDRRLALHFLLSRAERLGHGPERLLATLLRRGIDEAIASAAWDEAREQHALDPEQLLQDAIGRKLRRRRLPLDAAAFRSVYLSLLRAGFDESATRAALEPHLDPDARGESSFADG